MCRNIYIYIYIYMYIYSEEKNIHFNIVRPKLTPIKLN